MALEKWWGCGGFGRAVQDAYLHMVWPKRLHIALPDFSMFFSRVEIWRWLRSVHAPHSVARCNKCPASLEEESTNKSNQNSAVSSNKTYKLTSRPWRSTTMAFLPIASATALPTVMPRPQAATDISSSCFGSWWGRTRCRVYLFMNTLWSYEAYLKCYWNVVKLQTSGQIFALILPPHERPDQTIDQKLLPYGFEGVSKEVCKANLIPNKSVANWGHLASQVHMQSISIRQDFEKRIVCAARHLKVIEGLVILTDVASKTAWHILSNSPATEAARREVTRLLVKLGIPGMLTVQQHDCWFWPVDRSAGVLAPKAVAVKALAIAGMNIA